jgi:hypothetical protein
MIPQPLALVLATTAIVACTLPAQAQNKTGPNLDAIAVHVAQGGPATMSLAQELYRLGSVQGDAVTVLAAAKLAASVEVSSAEPSALDPETVTLVETPGQALFAKRGAAAAAPFPKLNEGSTRAIARASFFSATAEEEGSAQSPPTADAMFAKARELAADDAILGLIDDAQAEGSQNRMSGIVKWLARLPPGQADVWEIPFSGDTFAEVAIVGDGDANLDVAVTDESGNLICQDVSWSDTLHCDWTPASEGYFYVTIRNTGLARNSYYLMTN